MVVRRSFDPFRKPPPVPAMAAAPKMYKTFRVTSPRDTRIKAACEQVGCQAWRHGWTTTIDESTALGAQQALWIRNRSGRTFRESRTAEGSTVFQFESGQRCFGEHKTRPERFAVTPGVGRLIVPGQSKVHQRPEDWVEDLGEHQQAIIDAQARG